MDVILALLILLSAVPPGAPPPETLRLTVLQPQFSIERRWSGHIVTQPWAAWLVTGSDAVQIVHPLNLVGKVKIDSEAKALEYVRFFTRPETFDLFRLNGAVELVRGVVNEKAGFNVVSADKFDAHLRQPIVKTIPPGPPEFAVTRCVIDLDQCVYEVTELVDENGYYEVLSRRLVGTGEDIGVFHSGDL